MSETHHVPLSLLLHALAVKVASNGAHETNESICSVQVRYEPSVRTQVVSVCRLQFMID